MESTNQQLIIFPGEYTNTDACDNVINYVLRHNDHSPIGGNAIFPIEANTTIDQFQQIKNKFNQTNGRQVLHCCLSYPDNLPSTKYTALQDAKQLSQKIGIEFQNIYGMHEDTDHIHVHFAINSVSYRTGKKITGERLWELLK